ncbi:CRISPR-associated helicase Cas3' [Caldithrix abyssi]
MAPTSLSFNDEWLSHPDTRWIDHVQQVESHIEHFARQLPDSVSRPMPFETFVELCRWIALFHDLGKTTRFFQDYIRSEEKIQNELTRHALLSAVVGYWVIRHWLQQIDGIEQPDIIAFVAFMVIRYHHGNLHNPFEAYAISVPQSEILQKQWHSIDQEKLNQFWEDRQIPLPLAEVNQRIDQLPDSFKIRRQIVRFFRKRADYDWYFLTNTLFSLLLDADKSAAGLHELPQEKSRLGGDVVDHFRHSKGWDRPQTAFDQLRHRAYQEAIHTIEQNVEERIFTLQIPTGFGKTLTALSAALKLAQKKNLQRIIYSLPFTAIIDQNYEEIRQVLETYFAGAVDSTLLLKHHHLSDIFYQDAEEAYTTPEAELLIEGWHSQLVVTTFVQLFHTLVGYRNRALRKFHRLANAVIILDEIQSIPFKYWELLNHLLSEFAVRFNTTFILVTATQPRIFSAEKLFPLVKGELYFGAINRVHLHLHIEQPISLEAFLTEVLEKSQGKERIIVVLNTIKSAQEFHHLLKDYFEEVQFLSSHIVPKERLARIRAMNQSKAYVLVTTQIVEAGVNLDAEIVFRDWAPLDSINQVAGRCNRFNSIGHGDVHVYRLCNENHRLYATFIYDKVLLDVNQRVLTAEGYDEMQFLDLIERYFGEIQLLPKNDSQALLESIANLRYTDDERAVEHFQLIEQNYEKRDVFIELDEEAQQVWQAYSRLKEISDYWERREQYLKIKNRLQNYIISIGVRDLQQNPPPIVHGIYYVSYNQLKEYYDLVTGYKRVSETSIW